MERINSNPVKKRRYKERKLKEQIFYWSILILPLLQFIIMYVVVNINSFVLAFQKITYNINDGTSTTEWVWFDNFKQFITDVFNNPLMGARFANSFITYGISLFMGTVLSLFFSYYVYKNYFGTEFFRFMLILPSVISSVCFVTIFNYVADRVIPAVFDVPGLMTGAPKQTFWVVLAFSIFIGFGGGVLMYSSAMSKIPVSVVESCRLEGCSPFREFFQITLPLIYPTLETFLIIGISNIFINQVNIFTFFGEGADPYVQTVGYFLFNEVFTERATMTSYPYASAAGLTLTAVTIPIVLIARHFLDKLDPRCEF